MAITSKWDESEKIKVFIVSTVGRKVLASFNDIMYKQTDGVAMGSPLGPALANIFVGFYEEKLFSQKSKPSTYFRYVDDTFAMFHNEEESDNFFKQLNCLHPSLKLSLVLNVPKSHIVISRKLALKFSKPYFYNRNSLRFQTSVLFKK